MMSLTLDLWEMSLEISRKMKLKSVLWMEFSDVLSRGFQIKGIAKRGGHCSKAIYLNLNELNIKFLIKRSRSVAGKLLEIKKPPKNLVISPEGHKTSTNSSVRHCLQQRTY